MYLIHHACRLSQTSSLSLSAGCLSCLVIHPPHHYYCCLQTTCPAKAISPLLSGGRPCHPSPAAVIIVVWWRSCHSSPTSLSSSSTGHLFCKGLIAVIVQWGPCHPSSAIVVIVIVWWEPHCPSPMLSLLSAGHLPCGGLIAVIVQWGPPSHWSSLTTLAALSPLLPSSKEEEESWSSLTILVVVWQGPHHCHQSKSSWWQWHDMPAQCGEQQSLRWVSDIHFFSRYSSWQWEYVKGRCVWNSTGTVVSI